VTKHWYIVQLFCILHDMDTQNFCVYLKTKSVLLSHYEFKLIIYRVLKTPRLINKILRILVWHWIKFKNIEISSFLFILNIICRRKKFRCQMAIWNFLFIVFYTSSTLNSIALKYSSIINEEAGYAWKSKYNFVHSVSNNFTLATCISS
jgi:hypothetical protein